MILSLPTLSAPPKKWQQVFACVAIFCSVRHCAVFLDHCEFEGWHQSVACIVQRAHHSLNVASATPAPCLAGPLLSCVRIMCLTCCELEGWHQWIARTSPCCCVRQVCVVFSDSYRSQQKLHQIVARGCSYCRSLFSRPPEICGPFIAVSLF